MLHLFYVQISAAIAFIATLVGFVIGISRTRRFRGSIRVVARGAPARGTEVLWLGATFIALFWPVGIFLFPSFAYHWPPYLNFPYSSYVQVGGVVLAVLGGWLFSRSARELGKQMTPAIQIRQDHQLVQTGPYRFIRHPVYTAIMVIGLGQTLLFLSPAAAVLTALLAVLALYRARLEEALLASPEGFGATYATYISRTGRFFPRLRSSR
ncbi:MAG: methyltransferase family protein [Thermoplasmata archaeon]